MRSETARPAPCRRAARGRPFLPGGQWEPDPAERGPRQPRGRGEGRSSLLQPGCPAGTAPRGSEARVGQRACPGRGAGQEPGAGAGDSGAESAGPSASRAGGSRARSGGVRGIPSAALGGDGSAARLEPDHSLALQLRRAGRWAALKSQPGSRGFKRTPVPQDLSPQPSAARRMGAWP